MEDDFMRILRDMFVGTTLAPSDKTDALNFFFFRFVGIFGLIDLGKHQIELCFKLFSLLFFHKFLIPALMQLLDELIANPSMVRRHVCKRFQATVLSGHIKPRTASSISTIHLS
jgi:hypothetical protein